MYKQLFYKNIILCQTRLTSVFICTTCALPRVWPAASLLATLCIKYATNTPRRTAHIPNVIYSYWWYARFKPRFLKAIIFPPGTKLNSLIAPRLTCAILSQRASGLKASDHTSPPVILPQTAHRAQTPLRRSSGGKSGSIIVHCRVYKGCLLWRGHRNMSLQSTRIPTETIKLELR